MRSVTSLAERIVPPAMGFRLLYHPGEVNRCPGCNHSHWLVGRMSAQCAFCQTALPLALAANDVGVTPDYVLQ